MSATDYNLFIIQGRLAAPPELREFDSGSRLVRFLLTVRQDLPRRRVDVLPVTVWNPSDRLLENPLETGKSLWMCGTVQRRFWDATEGRRSRLELVAQHVKASES